MFEKFSVSFFETRTETNLHCVYVEIYDESLQIALIKKVFFSKDEIDSFLSDFILYFTNEEYLEILLWIEELSIPQRKRFYPIGKPKIFNKDQNGTK